MCAHEYFRELVRTDAFPRDYVCSIPLPSSIYFVLYSRECMKCGLVAAAGWLRQALHSASSVSILKRMGSIT